MKHPVQYNTDHAQKQTFRKKAKLCLELVLTVSLYCMLDKLCHHNCSQT